MVAQKEIHVLYSRIPQDLPDELLEKHLHVLPGPLRDKYFRYRRRQDRAANLFSKVLLLRGLRNFGNRYQSLARLEFTEYSRPFIPGTVDFNISHSGEYVICAVGENVRLGIDIEQVKDVDFAEFESLMTKEQWKQINGADDPSKEFYRFWAIKESIIKADGRGLSVPLNEILITENVAQYQNTWYLHELPVEDRYSAYLASDQEAPIVKIDMVELASL